MSLKKLMEAGWIHCPECGGSVSFADTDSMWTAGVVCDECGERLVWRNG